MLDNRSCDCSISSQAVDDRTLVFSQSCNIGINMQRVRISIESIEKSLIDKGLILKDDIGVAVGGWG